MCLVYTPDGIVLAIWILYYLSEVVLLEPSSTELYLERRLLDMRTGVPDSRRCRARRRYPRSRTLGAV